MRSYKIVLIFYIIAISFPIVWTKIMPTNCAKYTCEYIEILPQKPGSIVYIETSTFYNHILMFTKEDVIVESVRPFTQVTQKYLYNDKITLSGEAIYVLELKESNDYNKEEIMQEAATFAENSTNAYYDINFLNNKDNNYEELNCSELVWAAYYEAGIDLDSDGGIGVYPNDIYNSEYLEVVEIYYP